MVKLPIEFLITIVCDIHSWTFLTRKLNAFLIFRSRLRMFSSFFTRCVMAMKFRKISTMFFKGNYGFLFFNEVSAIFLPSLFRIHLQEKCNFRSLSWLFCYHILLGWVCCHFCVLSSFLFMSWCLLLHRIIIRRDWSNFHAFSCHWKFEGINKKRSLKSWNASTDRWWAIEFEIYSLHTLIFFFKWHFRFS